MKRPLAVALLTVVLALAAFAVLQRRAPRLADAPPAARNPGGYVASDVARLAATGRPQLAEVFHYG